MNADTLARAACDLAHCCAIGDAIGAEDALLLIQRQVQDLTPDITAEAEEMRARLAAEDRAHIAAEQYQREPAT